MQNHEWEYRVKKYRRVTWRLFTTLAITLIAFLVTGRVDTALAIATLDLIFKIIFHYIHCCVWNKVENYLYFKLN